MRDYILLPVVVALAIAIALITRVAPFGDGATGFNLKEAQVTLHAIASEPRSVGSVGHAKAQLWLLKRFSDLGLQVDTQSGIGVRQANFDARRKGAISVAPFNNIIATLPGRDRNKKAVALMAHYDSVFGSDGAADDGAGIASLLETARILAKGPKPARDVIFIATDSEELGLIGAQEFFDRHPLAKRIEAVVNVEARGSRGRAIMFQTSPGNAELIELWAANAVHPTGNSLANNVYQHLPNDTDLSVPLAKGITGINAAFIDRLKDYHMPTDTIENLDPHALRHLGNFALTTTKALAYAETLPKQGIEAAYFDFFGLFIVRYPMWFGWVLVAVGFAFLFTARLQRMGVRWPQVVGGALGVLGLMVGTGVIIHFVSAWAYGTGMIPLRERINEMGPALWMYVTFVSGVVLLARPKEALWVGSVVLMLCCALAAQIWMPGASWLFDWGGLIGAILVYLASRSGWQSSPVIYISALTGGLWGALLLTGVIVTYVSVAPMTPAPVALIIPFAITLIGPVIMAYGQLQNSRRVGGGLVALASLGAVWFALNPSFSERNPRPGDLFYYKDGNSGNSYWATSSTSHELPDGPATKISPKGFDSLRWKAVPAPASDVELPVVRLREQGDKIVLTMVSNDAPRLMNFIVKSKIPLINVDVNGKPVRVVPGTDIRLGWRSETPDAILQMRFDKESAGALDIDFVYAMAGMPQGAPPAGGPDTDWTRLNGAKVVSGSLNIAYGTNVASR
ncbi:M28 family peptidase [Sphingorhabdus lacus]|uniref:M20/M25/M40 family metallo-hydrolase n=1 Tax=Sphingorhabdus lacus TaxID=392610 RepID=A0A6I6LCH1_9SPHN|nr:M28 family peptidase [Sphingorhabdus lacus]QGY79993.1 M20/M25/M40 family metallo-hydrolase [Sphingorhabdus lacus]